MVKLNELTVGDEITFLGGDDFYVRCLEKGKTYKILHGEKSRGLCVRCNDPNYHQLLSDHLKYFTLSKKALRLSEVKEGDEIVALGTSSRYGLSEKKTYMVYDNGERKYIIGDYQAPLELHQEILFCFNRFIQHEGGWIGVDLDGTLAVYDGWKGPYHIGEPIPAMIMRVRHWLAAKRDVRIFTARVTERATNNDGTEHDILKVRACIEEWCLVHLNCKLPITNVKDWDMMELWDDRAVQVRPNTGVTLADELEAVKAAEATPKYPE